MKIRDLVKKWLGDKEGARPYSGIAVMLSVEVRDKDGKKITSFEQSLRSFVENSLYVIDSAFNQLCSTQVDFAFKDTAGDPTSMWYKDQDAAGKYCAEGGAGVDAFGILVGSSNTAWACTQYAMVTKISHGSGGGQLSYGACTCTRTLGVCAPAKSQIQRSFDNNSGAEITVREIGWVLKVTNKALATRYCMIARDVIAATAVPNGGRLTVKYITQINPT